MHNGWIPVKASNVVKNIPSFPKGLNFTETLEKYFVIIILDLKISNDSDSPLTE